MALTDQTILFLVSLLSNVLSAFAGGGAGLIQLPALIFLGLSFGVALATHKVATIFLGIGATLRNLKQKNIKRDIVIVMLFTGLPGVILGASIILHAPDRAAQFALGMMNIALGVYSWIQPELGQAQIERSRNRRFYVVGGLVMFVTGVLNGSLTSGTGLLATLWLVRWFGLDYKTAVAHTLVMVGLAWNATGALTLGILGQIAWDWLPALILGSLIGGYVGAHLAIIASNRWIKRAYEVLCIGIGIKLVVG